DVARANRACTCSSDAAGEARPGLLLLTTSYPYATANLATSPSDRCGGTAGEASSEAETEKRRGADEEADLFRDSSAAGEVVPSLRRSSSKCSDWMSTLLLVQGSTRHISEGAVASPPPTVAQSPTHRSIDFTLGAIDRFLHFSGGRDAVSQ